ncbi:hypothetical protein GDO78_014763 [Eleutherodactylus coqui]|uniref:Taste receptor type 2 n=1 Tax=Eleutherodactylus coqui TaxID=57060 RepID=A0A8J6BGL7_ELECQ|nr:hypothetical protein GDO78_014763 [Eleutherodactylus coqui]
MNIIFSFFLMPTNLFIFTVNILNWAKEKNLQQVDQLITSISVCNLVEEMLKLIKFLNIFLSSLMVTKFQVTLWCVVISCNLWFSTFLCVYFCLKIVNVKQALYMCLQRNFYKILPWIFLSSIMGSVLVNVPFFLKCSETSSNSTVDSSDITTERNFGLIHFCFYHALVFMIFLLIAMLIFSTSAFAVITSLFKHIKQVQQNLGGFRGPNMKAHVQASRTVTVFLFTYIFMFSILTVRLISPAATWSYALYPFFTISKAVSCCSLIKGNRNLDKALSNIFNGFHCAKSNNMEESL